MEKFIKAPMWFRGQAAREHPIRKWKLLKVESLLRILQYLSDSH